MTLVNGVLREWETTVNRVTKSEVGDLMTVCGRAATCAVFHVM